MGDARKSQVAINMGTRWPPVASTASAFTIPSVHPLASRYVLAPPIKWHRDVPSATITGSRAGGLYHREYMHDYGYGRTINLKRSASAMPQSLPRAYEPRHTYNWRDESSVENAKREAGTTTPVWRAFVSRGIPGLMLSSSKADIEEVGGHTRGGFGITRTVQPRRQDLHAASAGPSQSFSHMNPKNRFP